MNQSIVSYLLRFSAIFFFAGLFNSVLAQVPESAILLGSNDGINRAACADQFAGTVSLGDIDAQSNDIDLDRMFLCFGDQVQILHNGDADLTGDPDDSTPPGIGYAWYECAPSVAGPDLMAILGDPCLLLEPAPAAGIYIFADELNGNAIFTNDVNIGNVQTIQEFFNDGAPVEIFFAPITYDALDNGQAAFEDGGPCVNANTSESFSVVYLNPIQASNQDLIIGMDGCDGSFTIEGGLPEFDGSNYNITIELAGNPAVNGTVTSGAATHGDRVLFEVPEPGTYRIFVEDGKSCGSSFEMNLNCDGVVFNLPDTLVDPDTDFCLEMTVQGYDNIEAFSFALSWDPTVIEYISYEPDSFLVNESQVDNGALGVLWLSEDEINGTTLPDGSVRIKFNFRAVGEPGDMTNIVIGSRGTTDIIASDTSGRIPIVANNGKVTIDFPSTLGGDVSVCPANGGSLGFMSVVAWGGVPPYTIDWENSSASLSGSGTVNAEGGSVDISDLPADTYEVLITDSDGDFFALIVTITDDPRSTATFDILEPSCADVPNGSITANVNAIDPYIVSWSNGIIGVDEINGLSSGLYSATVEDGGGCETTFFVELEAEEITLDAQVFDETCENGENGSITVTASGGTPIGGDQYRYRWEGANSVLATSSTLDDLPGNSFYVITVTDQNNCATVDSFFIEPGERIFVQDIQTTEPLCFGEAGGSLSLTANTTNSGGSHAYLFDVFPEFERFNSRNRLFTDPVLEAGDYQITIIDFDLGLECFIDTTITIGQPDSMVIELVELRNESCSGSGGDGYIEVNVTGGTVNDPSDYEYDWGGAGDGPVLTDLDAGSYTLFVTDPNGCFAIETYDIIEAQAGEITGFDTTNVSCGGGNDGALTVFYDFGGATATEFVWLDADGNSYNGETITGLSANRYYVFVTADNGCVAIDSVELVEGGNISLDSIELIEPNCPGESTGEIRLSISGGNGAPLSYLWSPDGGPNGPVYPAIPAGTYGVTVSDGAGVCPPLEVDEIILNDPPSIQANITDITETSCFETCDGSAVVIPSGGPSGAGIFDYKWSSLETTQSASMLCPGSNWVIVVDVTAGCADSFFFDMPAPDTLKAEIASVSEPSCFDLSDGSITLSGVGGNPGYDAIWGGGQAGLTLSGVSAGTYFATLTDATNCSVPVTVELGEPDSLFALIDMDRTLDVSCFGANDGIIAIERFGGNDGVTNYDWMPDVSSIDIAENLMAGDYEVLVSDANGCSDRVEVTISEPQEIDASIDFTPSVACFGDLSPLVILSASGGNGDPYRYSVNNGALTDIVDTTFLNAGTYLIGVFDQNACRYDTTITIDQPQEIILELGPDTTVNLGSPVSLSPLSVFSPSGIDAFRWMAEVDDLSCIDCEVTTLEPSISEQIISLTVTDGNGCTAMDELTLFVSNTKDVFIPNAFSPDNNGINDFFSVYSGPGVSQITSFRVYNRWGGVVFERFNLPPSTLGFDGWNGNQNGEPLDAGVYIYTIEVEFIDGEVVLYKGQVHLIR